LKLSFSYFHKDPKHPDDLNIFCSFKHKEPNEKEFESKHNNHPVVINIESPSKTGLDFNATPYFYLTFHSKSGINFSLRPTFALKKKVRLTTEERLKRK
jgi:hypothetical protein